MAKNQPQIEAASTSDQVATKLTIVEFCTRLSESLSRPELIGAFESFERRSGRLKDIEASYRARFDTFINTPV